MRQKTLIIGVDFKAGTLGLCKGGIKLAKKMNASITLVHAFENDHAYLNSSSGQMVDYLAEQGIPNTLEHLEMMIKLYGVDVESIIEQGSSFEVLSKAAKRLNADLVILGTNKPFIFEEYIDSTACKLSNDANINVMVLKNSKYKHIRKVLCAFDYSDNGISALHSALNFTDRFDAELHVLHIFNQDVDKSRIKQSLRRTVFKMITKHFKAAAIKLKQKIRFIVKRGDTNREIINSMKEKEIDLITLGASSGSQLERFISGSTVRNILSNASCNVFISPDPTMLNRISV